VRVDTKKFAQFFVRSWHNLASIPARQDLFPSAQYKVSICCGAKVLNHLPFENGTQALHWLIFLVSQFKILKLPLFNIPYHLKKINWTRLHAMLLHPCGFLFRIFLKAKDLVLSPSLEDSSPVLFRLGNV
jgi:hypothetical protein